MTRAVRHISLEALPNEASFAASSLRFESKQSNLNDPRKCCDRTKWQSKRTLFRKPPAGFARLCLVALTFGGLTWAGFFLPAVPLWLTLLPLIAGVLIGTALARCLAMAVFLFWPVALAVTGLTDPWANMPAALLIWSALSALPALTGMTGATLLLLAIPVFPASPLLPLADALRTLAHPGLFALWLFLVLALLEMGGPRSPLRRAVLLGIALAPVLYTGQASETASRPDLWEEHPVPDAITERGQWFLLRHSLPEDRMVVLGENLFKADDTDALTFWCNAARDRRLALFVGVAEPYGDIQRSAVWRLDEETCRDTDKTFYRARFGIPGLTGTWGHMTDTPEIQTDAQSPEAETDWLICFEAFLPWAWAPLLKEDARPVLILSNDSAFGRYAPAVRTLRRKVSMAAGRPVFHAETGQTFLISKRTLP